jgi:hypothetical protein
MKAMILSIAVVMAAGCTTTTPPNLYKKWTPQEIAEYQAWKAKQPKIRFQPGTDMLGIAPSTVVFQDAPAPVQQQAPQPVIVTGPGSPAVTTASQVGGTTIISTIGNRAPVAAPIYTAPASGYYGY